MIGPQLPPKWIEEAKNETKINTKIDANDDTNDDKKINANDSKTYANDSKINANDSKTYTNKDKINDNDKINTNVEKDTTTDTKFIGPEMPDKNLNMEEEEKKALERLNKFKNNKNYNEDNRKNKTIHEDWMVIPPKAQELAKFDGKPRQFLKQPVGVQDNSLWFESEKDRRKRMGDEMGLAVGENNSNTNTSTNSDINNSKRKKLEESEKSKPRNEKSLLELHREKNTNNEKFKKTDFAPSIDKDAVKRLISHQGGINSRFD